MKIIENQWKSLKNNENHLKSMKIIENHWKSMKFQTIPYYPGGGSWQLDHTILPRGGPLAAGSWSYILCIIYIYIYRCILFVYPVLPLPWVGYRVDRSHPISHYMCWDTITWCVRVVWGPSNPGVSVICRKLACCVWAAVPPGKRSKRSCKRKGEERKEGEGRKRSRKRKGDTLWRYMANASAMPASTFVDPSATKPALKPKWADAMRLRDGMYRRSVQLGSWRMYS